MEVDPAGRDRLVDAIDRYLSDEITAFEFDERIFDIRRETHDPTVRNVVDALWYHYDDCDDHQVVLTKAEWDYFQRLRLLLESDASLDVQKHRVWSWTQLVAAAALAGFAWWATKWGFGEQLLIVAMPFGVVSIVISRWRRRVLQGQTRADETLVPFASVSQLRSIRRRVPGFRKWRYRGELATRTIHRQIGPFVSMLQTYSIWLLASPVVLLAQLFPLKWEEWRVVPSSPAERHLLAAAS